MTAAAIPHAILGVPFGGTTGQTLVGVTGAAPQWSDTFATAKTFSASIISGTTSSLVRNNDTSYLSIAGSSVADSTAARIDILGKTFGAGRSNELGIRGAYVLITDISAIQIARFDSNGMQLGTGTPTAGNGLLQLASGTTKANGIAFGTDAFLHRVSSGTLNLVGSLKISGILLRPDDTGILTLSGTSSVGNVEARIDICGKSHATLANILFLRGATVSLTGQSGTVFANFSSAGFHLRGGTPTTPSAFTAWTGVATRSSIATGSATVTNCAEAIKALIDDLKSIGVLP